MRKTLLFFYACILFASDWRQDAIQAIDATIAVYKQRLECLQTHEAPHCIARYPQDPRSDALAQTFAMSFPKAFYGDKLRRDIHLLQKQKLCIGKALSQEDAKQCATAVR